MVRKTNTKNYNDMTQEQLKHAAQMLLNTKQITGGDEPKFLPKIYVVDGHCYLFLNAARRAAFGTEHTIEVMTIEQAWEIHTGLPADTLKKSEIASEFDSTGSTFDGRLFCDNYSVLAGMVPNPVVNLVSGKDDPTAKLDWPINLLFLGARAQNILTRIGCRTYRDLLKFGREPLLKLRNVGKSTICEFDAEFDRLGLWSQWKYNKQIG